jgi:hypothetical protein
MVYLRTLRLVVVVMLFMSAVSCKEKNNEADRTAPVAKSVSVKGNKKTKTNKVKKRQKVDLTAPLSALVLNDMTSWNKFDFEKYLLNQGFEFGGSSEFTEYLARVKAFGFPEKKVDSVYFTKQLGSDLIIISRIYQRHYNYTDQQRSHVFKFKGDPRSYPDPYDARGVDVGYSEVDIDYTVSNPDLITPYITEIESLGCQFSKNIAKEIMDNAQEEIIPEFEREFNKISNVCDCPTSVARKLGDTNIFQGIIKKNSSVYYLTFSTGMMFTGN